MKRQREISANGDKLRREMGKVKMGKKSNSKGSTRLELRKRKEMVRIIARRDKRTWVDKTTKKY